MKVSEFIGRRYFFATHKNKNLIHLLSGISVLAVGMGTAALVIVLSFFNGLDKTVRSLYDTFDPEIRVSPAAGKTFAADSIFVHSIRAIKGVNLVVEVLEDNVLLKYKSADCVVRMRGLGNNYATDGRLDTAIIEGRFVLNYSGLPFAVVGAGVAQTLGLSLANVYESIEVWYPKNKKTISVDPSKLINRLNIMAMGVFAIERQFDEKYVFVPLSFAQRLFEVENRCSALEIKTEPGQLEAVQKRLKEQLGDGFLVQDRSEQHASLLRIMKIEKLFVFLALSFILLIASFNIYVALSMLIVEKKKDISTLLAMGASRSQIRQIFIFVGMFIGLVGAAGGLVLGLGVCLAQQKFEFIGFGGGETSLINAYPVEIKIIDLIMVFGVLVSITLLAVLPPAYKAGKQIGAGERAA